jgi:hypothetical protein
MQKIRKYILICFIKSHYLACILLSRCVWNIYLLCCVALKYDPLLCSWFLLAPRFGSHFCNGFCLDSDWYSGRKITESLGNVTVRGEKYGKSKGEARWPTVCLSMYSITENIYYPQLSSVATPLQPEPVSHRIIQGNDCVFSPSVVSSFGLPLPPTCLLLTASEARSYFASTIDPLS